METLRLEAGRERYGHFKLIPRDTALRADIYLLGDDPLHVWGFERRSSGSDRHLRGVAMMLQISDKIINHRELRSWIARLELEGAFEAVAAYDEKRVGGEFMTSDLPGVY